MNFSTLYNLSYCISLLLSAVTLTPEGSYHHAYQLSSRHPVLLFLYPIPYKSHPVSDLMKGCFALNFSGLWSSRCFCSCCCSFMLLLSNKPNEPAYKILKFFKTFFSARCFSSLYRTSSFIYSVLLKRMKQLFPREKLKHLYLSELELSQSKTKWLNNQWIFPLSDQWNFRFTLK